MSTNSSIDTGTASTGFPATLTLQPGARPLPDYELVRKLGEGGFGEVWQARGAGGLNVALKFIRLDARGSTLEMRSLEVMKSIRHPNLVGLFGAWQQDNVLILAMELCDRSLQDRLAEALDQKLPGIPQKELLHYLRDAASGLDALHDENVQHRDIKPANLMLLGKGVKVADFGLAKMTELGVASHTGAMTMAYAPPEFFKGESTPHSDQYSLATTYFHLRTGHLLFAGTYHQMLNAHVNEPPDLSALSAAEQVVLARALSKEPDKRWPNCETFVSELNKAYTASASSATEEQSKRESGGLPSGKETELLTQATVLPTGPQREYGGERTVLAPASSIQKRRFWPLLVGLLLALLLLGGSAAGLVILAASFFPFNWNQVGNTPTGEPNPKDDPTKKELSKTVTVVVGRDAVTRVDVPMEFVLIPAGRFKMGSSWEELQRPQFRDPFAFDPEEEHQVEITKPFYLARYPTTQQQYQAIVGKNPSYFSFYGKGSKEIIPIGLEDTRRFPVECVSWEDARTCCQKMIKNDTQSRKFRLPTEAEWEYACRAGTKTAFHFGNVCNGEQANCNGTKPHNTETKGPNLKRTCPVGSYQPNAWDLYDMHGNVWQWCEDYYGTYLGLNMADPLRSTKDTEEKRVLRGGSWVCEPQHCRAGYRHRLTPVHRASDVGFRVCFRPE